MITDINNAIVIKAQAQKEVSFGVCSQNEECDEIEIIIHKAWFKLANTEGISFERSILKNITLIADMREDCKESVYEIIERIAEQYGKEIKE